MYLFLFLSLILQLYFLGRILLYFLENVVIEILVPFINWANNLREKDYLIQIKRISYEEKDSDNETSDGETSDGETPDGETSDGETSDGKTSGDETSGNMKEDESKEEESKDVESKEDESKEDESKINKTIEEYNLPNSDTLSNDSNNSNDSEKKPYIDTTLD